MLNVLALIIGGSIGTVLRYLVSGFSFKVLGVGFPWGTLAVNLIGSFFIGVAWALFSKDELPQHFKLFLFTGVFGGFTTFSTFSLDTLNLLKQGDYSLAGIYVLASNIGGILLAVLGYYLVKSLSISRI